MVKNLTKQQLEEINENYTIFKRYEKKFKKIKKKLKQVNGEEKKLLIVKSYDIYSKLRNYKKILEDSGLEFKSKLNMETTDYLCNLVKDKSIQFTA